MRKIIRLSAIILAALLFTVGAVNTVFAITTADAVERIDTEKACSLTLTYIADDTPARGLDIEVFRAAEVTADFQYSMTGAFASYSIELNGIQSQSEWDDVRDTLTAYIAADGIKPTASQTTDVNGVVTFENLPVGIYYVRWTGNETEQGIEGFAPFMIAVPGLGEDGKWIYDVDALPKPGKLPEQYTERLFVVKLWLDGSNSAARPDSVSVDLIRDGRPYKKVTLSEESNWSYEELSDTEHMWMAVERDIAKGYSVTISPSRNGTITITNMLFAIPGQAPDTGDSTHLYFWIVLTAVSGIALIVLGTRRKKETEE